MKKQIEGLRGELLQCAQMVKEGASKGQLVEYLYRGAKEADELLALFDAEPVGEEKLRHKLKQFFSRWDRAGRDFRAGGDHGKMIHYRDQVMDELVALYLHPPQQQEGGEHWPETYCRYCDDKALKFHLQREAPTAEREAMAKRVNKILIKALSGTEPRYRYEQDRAAYTRWKRVGDDIRDAILNAEEGE